MEWGRDHAVVPACISPRSPNLILMEEGRLIWAQNPQEMKPTPFFPCLRDPFHREANHSCFPGPHSPQWYIGSSKIHFTGQTVKIMQCLVPQRVFPKQLQCSGSIWCPDWEHPAVVALGCCGWNKGKAEETTQVWGPRPGIWFLWGFLETEQTEASLF